MSRLSTFAVAAGLAVATLAAPAAAIPVTWTLHNVVFDDGATASGWFVYDADTNVFGPVDITTTSGAVVTGATYTLEDPGFDSTADFSVFVTGMLADYTGTPALALSMLVPLTNAGGMIPVSNGEFVCIDAGCTDGTPARFIVSDAWVAGVGVPEPATASILALGLFGSLYGRRRKAGRK
jgi:hypothetical protein